jgi:hypothetical protein
MLFAGAAISSPAAAQIYVMESTAAAIRVGSAIDMGDTLSIPSGGHIRAVLPSGKTQTIKGPYTGSVADLAKGQPVNEGVSAWIKNVLKTGGATESTAGATRSIARPPERPAAPFSWTAIPVADGSVCIEKGAKPSLVRAGASKPPERATIVDSANGQQADAQWAEGADSAGWPAGLALRADATYYVLLPDRPRRQITLRVLDRLPDEDDVLTELQRRGCSGQFAAWVRGKLAAAK